MLLLKAELARQFAELFAASGVTDALPLSMTVDGDTRVHVESGSRGRVAIGSLDHRRLFAVTSDYAETLELLLAERAAPLRDRERRTRYDKAVKALLSRDPPAKPTDGAVAEYLELENARTIRNWRRDGSIP